LYCFGTAKNDPPDANHWAKQVTDYGGGMELTWLNRTSVIAVLALYVAWSNYRRNNFTVLGFLDCGCGHFLRAGENRDRLYCKFSVLVRNLGIPLHNVHVALTFVPANGAGRLYLPM
jgi:hypothetical protein